MHDKNNTTTNDEEIVARRRTTGNATDSLTAAENEQRVGHTPGPWELGRWSDDHHSYLVKSEGGTFLAGAFYLGGTAQPEANARLISAAPDLLAVLKRALNWLSSYPGGNAQGVYDAALAAIAKAEGR